MEEKKTKRKLTTILSADVKGYSHLMQDNEEATVRTITAYREVMTNLIQGHDGRVVDAKGDNLLAEFPSVVDAVRCGVEIQKELKVRNAELPEQRRMEFRIGINLGDVIEEEETIYGDGVNIAARLEGLAEGGGICISRTAFDQVKNKLDVGYEYQGEHSVKNIAEPVRVYKVLIEPEYAGRVIGEERPKPSRWQRKAIAAIVILFVVAGALSVWNFYFRRPSVEPASVDKMAFPLPEKPSIAVLPFDNLSDDPKQEYFSDGLTEEIITALSKTEQMFVIARNSTFTYKGKPVKVQQVAEDLGIRYVLEGSVRKDAGRVRITAQLVDAIKGTHLWAERYDRDLKDIFAIQDDITKQIIAALHVKLTIGGDARLSAKGTDSLEAYLKFLQAREYHMRMTKEDNAISRRLVEEAISIDPEYGTAYSLLGFTHMLDVWLQATKSPKESMGKAVELSMKAVTLEGGSHDLLGWLYVMVGQYDKAIAECQKAVSLNPSSATARTFYGLALGSSGRFEEAVHELEQGVRLDPFSSSFSLRSLGNAYSFMGRHEEAISICKKAVQRAPNDLISHLILTRAYSMAGRMEEARTAAAEILRINPEFFLEDYAKRLNFKNQADIDRAIDALRKAGLPENPPLPLPDKPSIAVLPFVNMSVDPNQEYFSDGITEEIITALSKTPKLFVIAHNSTFTYKGKPVKVQQVGRELGVKYVLEGSVRKAEDKVRITAQLVDAKTGHHLWAERYDRELKDIFAVQDDISMKIITALHVKLTEGEQARLSAKRTDNINAYLKYLEGSEHLFRFNKDDNLLARQRAEEAMALDPEYSSAYVLLGKTHILDVFFNWSKSPKESLASAFKLAQKALAMNDTLHGPHRILGTIYLLKRQHDKAIEECERAVLLAPNSADAIYTLGLILRFAGRAKEAISMYERAIRLNPMPPASYFYQLALSYTFIGEFEKAIAICKKALPKNPDDLVGRVTLATAYCSLGREEEARAEAAEVLRIDPKFTVEYASKTWPYKNQADRDLVINALRKAGLK
ncbi:MAG: tetratricopeptide repeat protein [Desulfobacterales bacterium]|nr:tetratricopeptide repeat protein [Desulfobacterales bacterium]